MSQHGPRATRALTRAQVLTLLGSTAAVAALAVSTTPAPSATGYSLVLNLPIQTGGVSGGDKMYEGGCVSYPDTIIRAAKSVPFEGIARGMKNVMIVMPTGQWLMTKLDVEENFSARVDLSQLPTGPNIFRIYGWDSTTSNYTKQLVIDFCLLIDNPARMPATPPPVPQQAAGMKQIFFDDFVGPKVDPKWGFGVRPDGTQWGSGSHFVLPNEREFDQVFMVPQASFLRNRAIHVPDLVDPEGWGRKWVGGLLCTATADGRPPIAAFRKGCIEVRLIMPKGQGVWPAVWAQNLMGDLTRSAEHGTVELDLEYYGEGDNTKQLTHGVHNWSGKDGANGPFPGEAPGYPKGGFVSGLPDLTTEFHTILLELDDQTFKLFIDGVLLSQHPIARAATVDRFYWMINMAMSPGDWPIAIPQSGSYEMWVDYVRVFSADT